jgi:hypothetical protein
MDSKQELNNRLRKVIQQSIGEGNLIDLLPKNGKKKTISINGEKVTIVPLIRIGNKLFVKDIDD